MRRHGIGLLTLGCGALLAAGLADDPWWLPPAAACGLMAGLLGWLRPSPPVAPVAPPRIAAADMAPLLRELAEEMARLRRDGAEVSRGMAEARTGAARMAQAAATAIARLDESAETSAIAARALSMLPGIADNHAQRIELMAARAEQALAMVPESLAVPPPFAAALARLEGIALPDTDALRAAVDRLDQLPGEIGQAMHGSLAEAHDAAAALFDQAATRIEAARPDPLLSVALMEATERLDALAPPMERAREGADTCAEKIEAALESAAQAASADVARLEAVLERLATMPTAERLDGAIERLVALGDPALLAAQQDRMANLLADALTGLPETGHALHALLEPLATATVALPAMTESAQRATEALLRAAQANIALAGRARDVAPDAAPEPPRPPRLLENLDETIRGLQSLSTAITAAAERRLETAS